ncbi:MAG: hypothetical protein A2589_03240 [Candidatus Vogelbacteria bacterium RIFOXYD1_FULL_46_19]|uniref:Aspartyl/glutamyl-tRNA(Asn/Gln) amidotransferase subunit C n=1 Tax=Candidatus Vogelbacteria bacterium RIFOXYD1_FULL_46_19 TaxID=1802439 RepID=A0A1G2QHD2_9BACT|nr:MAG: hypothetical protein A2589_03240 [Candidatus Vogelbacteria bacterium RIFOXYD1_FULL_46_19]
MIGEHEVQILAELSRLSLTEAETGALQRDLDSILNYISQLDEVAAETPVHQDLNLVKNVLREDVEPHPAGLYTDRLLEAAPATENEMVAVKKILDNPSA